MSYFVSALLALALHGLIALGFVIAQWTTLEESRPAPRHIRAQMVDLSAASTKQADREQAAAQAKREADKLKKASDSGGGKVAYNRATTARS